ncbi:HD-GYP domain-containing protein [Desulfococcus sp.]|uniref:HD-GYP domain-containing protein n=1 Tax=Desulfococcus sp. TaxID=2025834 RepID=UPI00359360A4
MAVLQIPLSAVNQIMQGREGLGRTDETYLVGSDRLMRSDSLLDGYEVCRRLKASPKTRDIPIVFLTAMSEEQEEARGLALRAVDYSTKPFSPALVKARVRNQLDFKRYRDHLEELVRERTQQLVLTQDVTIQSMGTLAEYRDPETGGHIRRTRHYVRILAEHLKDHPKFQGRLDDKAIELLLKSAPLHDIGKVGVRDNILLKPGELTEDEFEEMKRHTIYGRDALLTSEKMLGLDSFLSVAREIAYTHHEKWDGTGYPQGLKGGEIPLFGRLMVVADVYDALISKRVYKPPYPHDTAVAMILEERGSHFDPDIVDVFMELSDEFRKIALEHADLEEERVLLSA